jgi:hypothetical protein
MEEFLKVVQSLLRLYSEDEQEKLVMSHELKVDSRKSEVEVGTYHSTASCIVRCCYQAMISEDSEDLVFAVVICRVCSISETVNGYL